MSDQEKFDWRIHRRCSVKGCGFFERRGVRLGNFVNGAFVCDDHYDEIAVERDQHRGRRLKIA